MKLWIVLAATAAACRATPAAKPAPAPGKAARWVALAGRYEAARKAGDTAATEQVLGELDATVPANPQIVFARARLAAERGDAAAALPWLEHYAAAGLVVPPGAPPSITTLLADPRAATIAARFAENARPRGEVRRAFALPTGDKLFEDVVWDAAAKLFYVSSLRDRRVYAVTTTGELRPLTEPEGDGIGVSGLALDAARHVLWLSTAALPPVPGYQVGDDAAKPSGLVAIDVASGHVLRRLALRPDGAKHGLTDLAVTPGGDVLASDATAGQLYIARHGAETIELLAADFMSPQTPAPQGAMAYVPDYSLGIARVDLATGTQRWLAAPTDVVLTGIDGLYLIGGALIAIQNGVQPPRIVRLELAGDGASVTAGTVLAAAPEIGDPTHAAIVGETIWFLGGSGWARFDETGKLLPDAADDQPAMWQVALRCDRCAG